MSPFKQQINLFITFQIWESCLLFFTPIVSIAVVAYLQICIKSVVVLYDNNYNTFANIFFAYGTYS